MKVGYEDIIHRGYGNTQFLIVGHLVQIPNHRFQLRNGYILVDSQAANEYRLTAIEFYNIPLPIKAIANQSPIHELRYNSN